MSSSYIDEQCINSIRMLSIDAVQKANSGHPGMPLGTAPLGYLLWTKFLSHNPKDPHWLNRDRFVLSAGHGSMLLYSLLYLTGYDLTLEDLKNFRQWESKTPGHPEYNKTPGVSTTTGPLGQGFGNGVGMAMAQVHMQARFNKPDFNILDHYTYIIASDGDMMEGVSSEAASLAGHYKLNKLICFYDCNNISLSASTSFTFSENVSERFKAYGWHTECVDDGNDLKSLDNAISRSREQTRNPSLIIVHTHIGYGSPLQDTYEVHGAALGEENVKLTKINFNWPLEPKFFVPDEALAKFREAIDKGSESQKQWQALFDQYAHKYPDLAQELHRRIRKELPVGWDGNLPVYPADAKGAKTRSVCGKAMNSSAKTLTELVGGSGDLNPSTNTALKGEGDFENPQSSVTDNQGTSGGPWNYSGRNIFYGVREHAMGAVSNGLAIYGGLMPFASTFLIFSDYMRPSIRLASVMKQHVIYIFTHDSIGLGEDGPTHQPIEHLMSLRAMPEIVVIRPCDANEAVEAWKAAVTLRDCPVALILTRQDVPTLDRSRYASAVSLHKGAYVLADSPSGKPRIILIATGSEVQLIVGAYEKLTELGIAARAVSMPSWELFEKQPVEYRESVIPNGVVARLAVEAGATIGWHKYTGNKGDVVGIDHFGASAPGKTILAKNGFTIDKITERALKLLGSIE